MQFLEGRIEKDAGFNGEEIEDDEHVYESSETNIKGLESLYLMEQVYFSLTFTNINLHDATRKFAINRGLNSRSFPSYKFDHLLGQQKETCLYVLGNLWHNNWLIVLCSFGCRMSKTRNLSIY